MGGICHFTKTKELPMSRKFLLLIAAAVISTPAFVTSNALAKGSAAAHGVTSTPHVSTLGVARRVAVPQAKLYGTPGLGSKKNASGSNPSPIQKALDVARAQQKAAQDAAKTSNLSPIQKALDVARAQQKAAEEAAAKAAREAAEAKAKLQTPVDPGKKVGSQIPAPPPPPPSYPKDPGGHGQHFPGGVVVVGSGVSLDPVVVEPGPVVTNSTVTARTATSPVVGAVTDGATTPRPNPCNCLVKERLADGGVLFMDICTKESARSVPTNETATLRDAQ
jgi:hypothetical protein